MHYKVLQ